MTTEGTSVDGESRARRENIRGRDRYRLVRDLAIGDATPVELADKFDCAELTVKGFAKRNAEEIDAYKADLSDDKLRANWSFNKSQRIAEYTQDIEDINVVLERQLESEGKLNSRLLEMKHKALESIAKELGQLLPVDGPVSGSLTVKLEGVDLEAL
jgi:hypothetical protein